MNGRLPDASDIMSSLSEENFNARQKTNETTFTEETATFTITPPNTTMQINCKIPLLTSIEQQDILAFRKQFNETAAICNWDENTSKIVLHSLTHTALVNYTPEKIQLPRC
jgi:hypothetical protein